MAWLRRRLWLVAALVALAVLGYLGLRPVQEAPLTVGVHVGQIAPDFTLPTLSGGKVHLRQLRGHPVWLNFFASWCPPCKAEAPNIEAAARNNPKLEIIGMNLTGSEVSLNDVRGFVRKFHLTYPVAIDQNNAVANRYQVQVIPTSFFIDAHGVIRDVYTGALLPGMIRSALAKAGYSMR